MTSQFIRVTYQDIEQLSDVNLTNLLQILLSLEANATGIPLAAINVSLKITVSDEGEDGRIEWQEGLERTNWIPNRFTLFQCKATNMSPADCKSEISQNTNALKPKVKEVFDANGTYVLFYGKNCGPSMKSRRIEAFREGIKSTGEGYADTASIELYDANLIASWVNQYISATAFVWNILGKTAPLGFRTWSKWQGYQDNRYAYISDEKITQWIEQIRSHLCNPKQVARIVGLSGLGKTRLAFEAFRPPTNNEDILQHNISNQMIYVDAASSPLTLPGMVSSWVDSNIKGILVVDNCEPSLHKRLRDEVQHTNSKLSLLTLDFNPDKQDNCPYIELEPVSDAVIKGILEQAYHGLPKPDIDRITDFAQGFPQMAVLLAEARINFSSQLGSLQDDEIIRKLLWGRNSEDPIAYKVITTCSLFEILGYSEDMTEQRVFAAEKICGIDKDEFYEKTRYFIQRGILDVRGRFVRVTPRPLAIRLAADWWTNCSPERAKTVVLENYPNGLDDALCKQLAKLDFLPEAQKLTEDLCGAQAPFGQAEVLTTEKGLRLFRSFVEVNPKAAIEALNRVFGEMSREELLKIDYNMRRDLVRSLELLCFWEDTFLVAASLLCSLAAAENETWANNATGQFKQLFHYTLSGTQANLKSRIILIDKNIKTECVEKRKVCIQALSCALQNGHFSRMVGPELQGSRPAQEEYRPSTWEEIFEYWTECLERLVQLVCSDDELADYAQNLVASRIRGLLGAGRISEIENCIKTIVSCRGPLWPEALSAVQDSLRYEGSKMPQEIVERIRSWFALLQPDDIVNQLKLIVSIPPWNHEKNDQGKYEDLSALAAIDFAKKIATDVESLVTNVDIILHGEQRQGLVFGQTLGEYIDSPSLFIEAACKSIARTPSTANSSVLGGFLVSMKMRDPQMVDNALMRLEELSMFSEILNVMRYLKPTRTQLDLLLRYVYQNNISVHELLILKYGGALDHLCHDDMEWFMEQLLKYDLDGHAVAFDLLYMHTFQDHELQKSWISLFKQIISSPKLLINNYLDLHIWESVCVLILNSEVCDDDFIRFVTNEIISALAESKRYLDLNVTIKDVLVILFKYHYTLTWPLISEILIEDRDYKISYEISHLLESSVEFDVGSNGYVSLIPEDYLIEWCDTLDKALVLSNIAPVYSSGEHFSSIATHLFNSYGANRKVLMNIYRNLTPNSWSGSIIPYYEQAIEVLKQLREHHIAEVSLWSKEVIEYFNKSIQTEKRREDEHDIGVY
ncbi:hypothetical protein L1N85_21840 [Paenibacillus alkaliterrae]|uniref:hypothetical protein n=1 Tax=Paenibacillus alkaliterrae TaxID=320909 RepID=UPI001F4259EF|nr:hypothetical protein [Paenibacillus alkaliterrae]MCF2941032.1 hypothetical protein [Paenibacillus alkaliterrae]